MGSQLFFIYVEIEEKTNEINKAIYKITNMINNKIYIGQSVDPNHRFISHCSRANNDSDNSPIHTAIKKYGKENFVLDIIEWTEDYNNRERRFGGRK